MTGSQISVCQSGLVRQLRGLLQVERAIMTKDCRPRRRGSSRSGGCGRSYSSGSSMVVVVVVMMMVDENGCGQCEKVSSEMQAARANRVT